MHKLTPLRSVVKNSVSGDAFASYACKAIYIKLTQVLDWHITAGITEKKTSS